MNGTNDAAAAAPMRLKLLIDTRGKRVVYAEAEKNFVDFLLRILSLPLTNAAGLLGNGVAALGSISNLHGSIDSLKNYLTSDNVLKPATNLSYLSPANTSGNRYCTCNPQLMVQLLPQYPYGAASNSGGSREGGVVKGLVSYMVTDDLRVMPLTTASAINEMNKLNVERMTDLQETLVQFTMDEADKFLKVALQSKSVLTDFFLKNTLLEDTSRNGERRPQTKIKTEIQDQNRNSYFPW